MKLIFIRHAEPDYEHDSLTPKGWREAELLAERVKNWDVTDFYVSPLGRAKATASLSLEKMGRTAETLDWLHEFDCRVLDPDTGKTRVPWNLYPGYWTEHEELMDLNRWHQNELMLTNTLEEHYAWTSAGLDELLKKYGYIRKNRCYEVTSDAKKDATVVCFCHLGITLASLAHLFNMTPPQTWQAFFTPPSSVTVLGTEERVPGIAQFRCQMLGDTSHLLTGGEPVSSSGYFTESFQG